MSEKNFLDPILDFDLLKDSSLSEPIDFEGLKRKLLPFYFNVSLSKNKFSVDQIHHFDKGILSFWKACDYAQVLAEEPLTNQKERLIVQQIINDYLLEARKEFELFKNESVI